MSTEKTTLYSAPRQPAKAALTAGRPPVKKRPAIQNIEVTPLELDESHDVDCDPYNRTGQYLVDAAKLRKGK